MVNNHHANEAAEEAELAVYYLDAPFGVTVRQMIEFREAVNGPARGLALSPLRERQC